MKQSSQIDLMGCEWRSDDSSIRRHGWPRMQIETFSEMRREFEQFLKAEKENEAAPSQDRSE